MTHTEEIQRLARLLVDNPGDEDARRAMYRALHRRRDDAFVLSVSRLNPEAWAVARRVYEDIDWRIVDEGVRIEHMYHAVEMTVTLFCTSEEYHQATDGE